MSTHVRGRRGGKKRRLAPWQEAYVVRAFRLRRQLSNKKLCQKFDIGPRALSVYGNQRHKQPRRKP